MTMTHYTYSTNIAGSEFINLKLVAEVGQLIKVEDHVYEIVEINNEHLTVMSHELSINKDKKVKVINPIYEN